MVTVDNLQKAPTVVQFCSKIQLEEDALDRHEVSPYDLKLYPDGMLKIASKTLQGKFTVSEQALPDIARIPEIPAQFFGSCDLRLRSACFNWRLHKRVVPNKPIQVVLRSGVVDRILNTNLLPMSQIALMNTVSNAKPEKVLKANLRVIKYGWNGHFNVSIIEPTQNCQPRSGDIVAFGVNINEGRDGAIQIQGAAFRCWCSNGAVNRICDSRQHRLRRPINRPDRQQQFLNHVSVFSRDAWSLCAEQKMALPKLTDIPIEVHERSSLRSRLRQAPFFLSVRVISQVLQRLEFEVAQHQEGASLYDLYNSMSFLGTHNRTLSDTYRTRLRLGTGEFSRHEPRICGACRQLLLDNDHETTTG